MSLLEVVDLRKSYGDKIAVNGLSFEIEAGEVFGLLGPNGAGKSTTMTMISGLKRPDSGTIRLDGLSMTTQFEQARKLLGLVPQDLAIYPDLTARENMRFFGQLNGLRGRELKTRSESLLEQVGLSGNADNYGRTFSGGMKRRLNFAVALLHHPKLVILDEPTVGVDPQSRSHLLDCVRRVSSEGAAVIYASHYMEEVESICQRIAIIDHGKLLTCGTIESLLNGTRTDIHLIVRGEQSRLGPRLVGLADVEQVSDQELKVVLLRTRRESAFAINDRLILVLEVLKQAGTELLSINTQEHNLERLFLELTGRRLRD